MLNECHINDITEAITYNYSIDRTNLFLKSRAKSMKKILLKRCYKRTGCHFTGSKSLLYGAYPLGGSAIIARGLTRSESTMTFRCDPSRDATSMRSFTESVQNSVRPKWSIAMPSGQPRSVGKLQFVFL